MTTTWFTVFCRISNLVYIKGVWFNSRGSFCTISEWNKSEFIRKRLRLFRVYNIPNFSNVFQINMFSCLHSTLLCRSLVIMQRRLNLELGCVLIVLDINLINLIRPKDLSSSQIRLQLAFQTDPVSQKEETSTTLIRRGPICGYGFLSHSSLFFFLTWTRRL